MNKDRKKRIFKKKLLLLLFAYTAIILTGCSSKNFLSPKANYITFEDIKYYTSGEEHSLTEPFEMSPNDMNLRFAINKVEITKSAETIPKISAVPLNNIADENGNSDFKFDENSDFIDNHNYFILSGEVTNIGSSDAFFDFMFHVYDKNKENPLTPNFTGDAQKLLKKDAFILSSLKPNATFDFKLVYIITDDSVSKYKDNSYLAVSFNNINNPVIEFVKLSK